MVADVPIYWALIKHPKIKTSRFVLRRPVLNFSLGRLISHQDVLFPVSKYYWLLERSY